MMLAFWPAAQLNPISYVLDAIQRVQAYPWNLPVLFGGELVRARDLPRSYVLQWMLISLPEFIFLGLAACFLRPPALFRNVRERGRPNVRWIAFAVLIFATFFPLAYQALRGSRVYDAWRHFLFVAPSLAVLVACALSSLLADSRRIARMLKWPIMAGAALSALVTLIDMVQLHPYQTIYFNRAFAGGVARAADSYEADYWGSSYKEGVEWLEANYRTTAPPGSIKVGSCSHPFSATYFLTAPRFVHIGNPAENGMAPDIALATTRWNCHKRVGGRVLHVVQRKGARLLYITEVRSNSGRVYDGPLPVAPR